MGEVTVAVAGREVVGLMRPSVGGVMGVVLKSPAVAVAVAVTKFKSLRIKAHHPSTYSSSISTDIPLYETPKEEWRVHMLPIEFLFMTVAPVIDMRLRCKTRGKEYPAGISPAISKVLELDIVRWELQGLDDAAKPTQFNLGVKGALYPDRRGLRTRLKGQLEMKISVILPPMLALVPEYMLRSVSETVLRKLVENMKDKVNSSLLADYSEFRKERQMDTIKN